jgi:hypothetical protein
MMSTEKTASDYPEDEVRSRLQSMAEQMRDAGLIGDEANAGGAKMVEIRGTENGKPDVRIVSVDEDS